MKSLSFKTNFGWISIFEQKNKIVRIKFGKCKSKLASNNLKRLKIRINNFFLKKTKIIKANYMVQGNIVQKKVWKELTRIGYGKTRSYGDIGKKFKLSPRYIGKICAQNKIPLIIPCHRVVRSDGSLGGFSARGGIVLKKKLLEFEKS